VAVSPMVPCPYRRRRVIVRQPPVRVSQPAPATNQARCAPCLPPTHAMSFAAAPGMPATLSVRAEAAPTRPAPSEDSRVTGALRRWLGCSARHARLCEALRRFERRRRWGGRPAPAPRPSYMHLPAAPGSKSLLMRPSSICPPPRHHHKIGKVEGEGKVGRWEVGDACNCVGGVGVGW